MAVFTQTGINASTQTELEIHNTEPTNISNISILLIKILQCLKLPGFEANIPNIIGTISNTMGVDISNVLQNSFDTELEMSTVHLAKPKRTAKASTTGVFENTNVTDPQFGRLTSTGIQATSSRKGQKDIGALERLVLLQSQVALVRNVKVTIISLM